ncbi:MAG: thioesterase family protein [Gammaproteobacteria bacterium]|nr:thioesterase family protein [Gammaproteobacteria bacterium]
MLDVGSTAESVITVSQGDSAQALALSADDSFPAVFATSRMIALMELAAARLMKPLLENGQLSVGVSVHVRHIAATPVGCRVRAVATYLGADGKLSRFRVEAFDEAGLIGDGEHTRAVVALERLIAGAEKRRQ